MCAWGYFSCFLRVNQTLSSQVAAYKFLNILYPSLWQLTTVSIQEPKYRRFREIAKHYFGNWFTFYLFVWWFILLYLLYFVCSIFSLLGLFWGHNWRCSKLTPGSVLRVFFWLVQGCYMGWQGSNQKKWFPFNQYHLISKGERLVQKKVKYTRYRFELLL